jgi:hypothetical protein
MRYDALSRGRFLPFSEFDMPLKIGDLAPSLSLLKPDGAPTSLADYPAAALVLVFLRHLA